MVKRIMLKLEALTCPSVTGHRFLVVFVVVKVSECITSVVGVFYAMKNGIEQQKKYIIC